MRKPTCILIAYAMLSATAVSAYADSFRNPPSCEEWIYQFNKNNTGDLSNKSWLGGFLAGLNFDRQKSTLRGVSDSSIFHSVYAYCKANPNETIDYGVAEFFSDIEKCSDPELLKATPKPRSSGKPTEEAGSEPASAPGHP